MERGQNSNINRSLEEADSNLHRQLWGVQDSVEEVTADVIEITTELQLATQSEDVTELLQSDDKTFMYAELLLMVEQRKKLSW